MKIGIRIKMFLGIMVPAFDGISAVGSADQRVCGEICQGAGQRKADI